MRPLTNRSPYNPKLAKDERKALAARVRDLLRDAPLDMAGICQVLEIEPEVAVVALRELRSKKRGALRSTIRLGHVCWWWEAATEPPPPESPAPSPEGRPEEPGKKRKKAGKKSK